MESAKKKEILNSYLEASKEWRYWKDETERLMVAATGASPSLSGMPHGGGTGTSKVELAAESLEDARRELTAAASAMSKARRQVLAVIKTAPTADQRIVLRRRYINGMNWEQIAEACGKSRQWATMTHGEALKKIFLKN